MHASKKNTEKNISFWKKKLKLNFWILDPIFRKSDQKTRISEKHQIFEKVIFDVKNAVLGKKITTGWYFLGQTLKKKRFFENFAMLWFFQHKAKSGLAEGLVP